MRPTSTVALSLLTATLMCPAILPAQAPGGQAPGRREAMLRGMDANGNGKLDPGEIRDNRARFFIHGIARKAGMDPSKPIPIRDLLGALP